MIRAYQHLRMTTSSLGSVDVIRTAGVDDNPSADQNANPSRSALARLRPNLLSATLRTPALPAILSSPLLTPFPPVQIRDQ